MHETEAGHARTETEEPHAQKGAGPEEVSSGTVLACPECDSARIERRSHSDHRWNCQECGNRFTDAARRRSRMDTGSCLSGSAKLLADKDPEEVL